jgi:hypothetical protein
MVGTLGELVFAAFAVAAAVALFGTVGCAIYATVMLVWKRGRIEPSPGLLRHLEDIPRPERSEVSPTAEQLREWEGIPRSATADPRDWPRLRPSRLRMAPQPVLVPQPTGRRDAVLAVAEWIALRAAVALTMTVCAFLVGGLVWVLWVLMAA